MHPNNLHIFSFFSISLLLQRLILGLLDILEILRLFVAKVEKSGFLSRFTIMIYFRNVPFWSYGLTTHIQQQILVDIIFALCLIIELLGLYDELSFDLQLTLLYICIYSW